MVGQRVRRAIAIAGVVSLLTSCAGSSLGEKVGQSLEADPQLEESPPFGEETEANGAEGQETEPTASPDTPEDSSATEASEDSTDDPAAPDRPAPAPGAPDFVGPTWPSDRPTTGSSEDSPRPPSRPDRGTDLEGIPPDLQTYIRDLQTLDLLDMRPGEGSPGTTATPPSVSPFNQTITRREYARWLFQVNNTLFADAPAARLRAGSTTDEPAFQDVPTTDPDFAAIQGLANAGIIPSAFTGNSTAVTFRPDAPLVREDLILWKVPLDTRSALPQTSPETVSKTWGFQDTEKIDPLALRAIAADFQLGDFSNIRRAFGYTTLFRPDKAVSRAEAAAVLWRFGSQTEGRSAAEASPDQTAPPANN